MLVYVVIGIVLLIVVICFLEYNSFVKLDNKVNEAFATMDVYLKKRWDLIPNLIETVKGYAKHEKDTLEEVIQMRNSLYDQMNMETKIHTNEQITGGISKIMALAESYPKLKADKHFLELSKELTRIEDEIAQSRKYYNATIRIFNNKVGIVPSNFFAKIFGFNAKKMFEVSNEERNNIRVEL